METISIHKKLEVGNPKLEEGSKEVTFGKAIRSYFFMLVVLLLIGDLFMIKASFGFWDMGVAISNMKQQIFPEGWETALTWINLVLGMLGGLLLIGGILLPVFRLPGLVIIEILLAGYTAYSQLAWMKALPGKSCECINWIPGMGWGRSLTVNGVLLLLCTAALLLVIEKRKERREPSNS